MEANKITLKTLAISLVAVLAMEITFSFPRWVLKLILFNAIPIPISAVTILETATSFVEGVKISYPLPALGIFRCIEAILLLIIAARFEKNPNAIGLSQSEMLPGLKRGLMWSAGFGIAAGILFSVLLASGVNPLKLVHTPLPSASRQIIFFFLVGGVIGPIWEEIFFRGIIFGFFRRWGLYTAILISTALFVLPHYDGNHLPFTQIVGGIVFAAAYEKGESLVAPITIHCLGNIAMFSLTLFS